MKKFILLLFLCAILIATGCSSKPAIKNENDTNIVDTSEMQDNSSLIALKDKIKADGKLFGVSYLGWIEGDFVAAKAELLKKEYIKDIPFINDIDKTAENEGYRMYLVVPTDDVVLSVCTCEFNDEYMPYAGEELITSNEPILVRGNMSDTIPNLYIVGKKDLEKVEYTPLQSGMDGKLENGENKVYDFTPYDLMPEFLSNY